MNSTIVAALFVVVGEAAVMYSEIMSARLYDVAGRPFWEVFFKLVLVVTLGAWVLMIGYMLGLRAFQNIWIVAVISLTSILIIEPFLNWTILHQLPTRGALIGLVLGIFGLLSALLL